MEEYNHDPPAPGSDSEAEEDNSADPREDMPTHESPMNAVSPRSPPRPRPRVTAYTKLSSNQDSREYCSLSYTRYITLLF